MGDDLVPLGHDVGNQFGIALGDRAVACDADPRADAFEGIEQAIEADARAIFARRVVAIIGIRSEEHTSELQSLMRISYAVFCLKNKKYKTKIHISNIQ